MTKKYKYLTAQINKRKTKGYWFIGYPIKFGGRDQLYFNTYKQAVEFRNKNTWRYKI
jgi:hypothetical protein